MNLGPVTPALPVADIAAAVEFYRGTLAFAVVHETADFAMMRRDQAVVHLWHSGDTSWQDRDPGEPPVRSGAESFLAGTASCRIATDDIDDLFLELSSSGALHPVSRDGVIDTDHGTREVNVLDVDGNLLTFYGRA